MDILSVLYSCSGVLSGAAFIPQILTLLRDSTGAASINIGAWVMFTWCSSVSFSYAMIHSHDTLFVWYTAIGTLGNSAVLLLAIYHRVTSTLATASRQ